MSLQLLPLGPILGSALTRLGLKPVTRILAMGRTTMAAKLSLCTCLSDGFTDLSAELATCFPSESESSACKFEKFESFDRLIELHSENLYQPDLEKHDAVHKLTAGTG